MKKKIVIVSVILALISTGIVLCLKEDEGKERLLGEYENILSYIVDGETSSEKPSKDLYLVNKIICDSGSNIIWDNIKWEVSFTKLESTDKCKVEFISKDSSSTDGRIVTINEGKEYVDSYSKTTVDKGTIKFYPKSGYEIKSVSGCSNGKVENGELIVSNVTGNQTCNVVVGKGLGAFAKQILADNPTVSTRNSFTSIFTENTPNTIYKTTGEDGETDVYYFAGGETESLKINNWVKFGQDKDGNNLYWRIIRTNADGGVRLLYAGSSNSTSSGVPTMTNAVINSSYSYSTSSSNSRLVGYMYGASGSLANNRTNTTSSTIKGLIDTWYDSGLNTKTDGTNTYDKYISKGAIYCNDRAHSGTYYATSNMNYAGFERLVRNRTTKVQPTYVCGQDTNAGTALNTSSITSGSEDKFSVSTSQGGNGKLQYPVALMTADEVSYAGGFYGTNNPTAWYSYNAALRNAVNSSWWTMTPYSFVDTPAANVFIVDGSSDTSLGVTSVTYSAGGVRPVVSLKSCVKAKEGTDGSVEHPYEVEISEECALEEEPKGPETLKEHILANNPTIKTRDTFTSIFTGNTANIIYKATGEDGKSDVYYFAGGETSSIKINNWVKFGQDKDGNNLYWRIIRTNADGGVRLLYAGSSNSTGTSVPTMTNALINTSTAYNSTYNNSMYVGYMYGTTGSLASNRNNTNPSTIKGVIDTWYNNGLNAKSDGTNTYDKYISKGAIYCNDRAHSGTYYSTGTTMHYATYERLVRNYSASAKKVQPTYVCGKDTNTGTALNTSSITSGSEDKFSASTSQGGNGKLQYPVALMTADEVSYAGGFYGTNHGSAWYYYNAAMASATGSIYWWTMSPYYFYSSGFTEVFSVHGSGGPGQLYSNSISSTYGVRPVVSLKSCVSVTGGNGSVANPYVVGISSTCAQSDE